MKRSVLLALGVPAALVLGPIPPLMSWGVTVHGWPASVVWMFCCIPLVSICMMLAERLEG